MRLRSQLGVCYGLGVTEVDPARMSVLFERFISVERREPPHIDLDFDCDCERQRRQEVMHYIYRNCGRERASLRGVVIIYSSRSAIRDLGRRWPSRSRLWTGWRRLLMAPTTNGSAMTACRRTGWTEFMTGHWLDLAHTIRGLPRHLSQHIGGSVIARDKLSRLVQIENAAMEYRNIVHWDKDDLNALGLIMVDVPALGMLAAIHRALDLMAKKLGRPMRMQDVPAEVRLTYAIIQKPDTVGVIQIESRAQMTMLPWLKPERLDNLVI